MTTKERIEAFSKLGDRLRIYLNSAEKASDERFETVLRKAHHHNGWFDRENVLQALREIAQWLSVENLTRWVAPYRADFKDLPSKRVGIIMAGNIPAVGFHDFLTVLISGHNVLAKLSGKDEVLMRFLKDELVASEPRFDKRILFTTGQMKGMDAVIATGSDNSARYFDYYFGKLPNIIRKNRNSVAILTGNESAEELFRLGNDIFSYYGLGCRNVSKLFVPENYQFDHLFEAIYDFGQVMKNNKYHNNYEYHRALFLLNNETLLDNNFVLLKQDQGLSSPVGTLYFEEYKSKNELFNRVGGMRDKLQCVIGKDFLDFGESQRPKLEEFADNVNVLEFSTSLK